MNNTKSGWTWHPIKKKGSSPTTSIPSTKGHQQQSQSQPHPQKSPNQQSPNQQSQRLHLHHQQSEATRQTTCPFRPQPPPSHMSTATSSHFSNVRSAPLIQTPPHRFGSAELANRVLAMNPNARLRSVSSRPGQDQVLAEYVVEHEVKVPKRTMREDFIERTYVVPERVVVEEIVEESAKVMERVVEYAQPIVMEKIVEVPEIEYIERIVEVPQKIVQEKIREVCRVDYQERIIEIPKLIPKEKIVNVPVYEYHDLPVEKIVEVPQIREQIVIKEISVPQYIERPVPEERIIKVRQDVPRKTPVPVEAVTNLHLTLPKIRPVYQQHEVPVYVPRFIEVPVAAEFCSEEFLDKADRCVQEVSRLAEESGNGPVSLCALEDTAGLIQNYQFDQLLTEQSFVENFARWWRLNQISVDEMSLQSICRTVGSDGAAVTEAVSLVRLEKGDSQETTYRRRHQVRSSDPLPPLEDSGDRDDSPLATSRPSATVPIRPLLLGGEEGMRLSTMPDFPEMKCISTSAVVQPMPCPLGTTDSEESVMEQEEEDDEEEGVSIEDGMSGGGGEDTLAGTVRRLAGDDNSLYTAPSADRSL